MICHQEITSAHLVVSPRIYNSQNEQTEYRAADHAEQRQRRLHHYIAQTVLRGTTNFTPLRQLALLNCTSRHLTLPGIFAPVMNFFQFCSKCIGVSHAYTYLAKFN